MPVLPAVASTIVPPERILPSCSARRMMPIAARSFTLPPGFRYSSLAKRSADPLGTIRFSCSIGVSPTSWVMSSATRRRDISDDFELTLQGTEDDGNRQSGMPPESSFEGPDQHGGTETQRNKEICYLRTPVT